MDSGKIIPSVTGIRVKYGIFSSSGEFTEYAVNAITGFAEIKIING